jgi:hypothetical protein
MCMDCDPVSYWLQELVYEIPVMHLEIRIYTKKKVEETIAWTCWKVNTTYVIYFRTSRKQVASAAIQRLFGQITQFRR